MDKEGTITNKTSKIRKNKNEYNIILKLILLIYRAKFFQHSKIRLTIIKYTGKRTIPSKNYLLLLNHNNDSNHKIFFFLIVYKQTPFYSYIIYQDTTL